MLNWMPMAERMLKRDRSSRASRVGVTDPAASEGTIATSGMSTFDAEVVAMLFVVLEFVLDHSSGLRSIAMRNSDGASSILYLEATRACRK
jgi:hypothetical protein